MQKTALLHPSYLPGIDSYIIIANYDNTIFEIKDNYQKQSHRNRTYINTANGSLSLTIPIKHHEGKGHKKMEGALIENDFKWQRQHWRAIEIAYRSSPYFEFYEDDLKFLFEDTFDHLLTFNIAGISCLNGLLGISEKIECTTVYDVVSNYDDHRRLVSAKAPKKIEIPLYSQVFDDRFRFNPEVSILDLLFNKGPNSLSFLESIPL